MSDRRTATPTPSGPPPARPPKLRLPFEGRPRDAGEWAYDHRIGLLTALIAYLVVGILLVGAKIVLHRPAPNASLYVQMEELERLAEERARLEQEVRERLDAGAYDMSPVQNRASNEAAETAEAVRAAGGAADRALQERLQANREAWEQGLREEQAIREGEGRQGEGEGEGDAVRSDARVEGHVTVSYTLDHPLRQARRLVVPAYQCEGGGQVVVRITVDHNGRVISAAVDRAQSDPDACLEEAALRAARASRFNLDTSAPTRHEGTIRYLFVPQ